MSINFDNSGGKLVTVFNASSISCFVNIGDLLFSSLSPVVEFSSPSQLLLSLSFWSSCRFYWNCMPPVVFLYDSLMDWLGSNLGLVIGGVNNCLAIWLLLLEGVLLFYLLFFLASKNTFCSKGNDDFMSVYKANSLSAQDIKHHTNPNKIQ